MTKALRKNLARTIRGSFGRFIAILLIVALGVTFLAGLKLTRPVMRATLWQYTKETGFYDLRLLSSIGWTEEDVAALGEVEGVKSAAPSIQADLAGEIDGVPGEYRAHMITTGVNEVTLLAGRMPEKADECLGDNTSFGERDLGKTLHLKDGAGEGFSREAYTLVGIADGPQYISRVKGATSLGDGSLDGSIYLLREGFDRDVFTEAFLVMDGSYEPYTASYDEALASLKERAQKRGEERLDLRWNEIVSEFQREIDEKEKEAGEKIAQGERELANARAALDEGREELAAKERELSRARASLSGAGKELDAAAAGLGCPGDWDGALAVGKERLAIGKETLARQRAKSAASLAATGKELDEKGAELDLAEAQFAEATDGLTVLPPALAAQKDALLQARAQWLEMVRAWEEASAAAAAALAAGEEALEKSEGELNGLEAGIAAFRKGEQAVKAGEAALESGKRELAEKEADYADGLATLEKEREDARRQISEAREELAQREAPVVYVLDRSANVGYAGFESDSEVVERIAAVLPIFFFLVAALISSTTMTRMVEEERGQMGTLRSLGYSRTAVLAKYVVYSGTAAATGCVAGYALGGYLFPFTIWRAYSMLYNVPGFLPQFDGLLFVVSLAASLLSTVGVTVLACQNEMRSTPAALCRPRSPAAGKRVLLERVPFVWSRLSFLRKVTVRNIFRFRKRLFMMLLGIAGCTALLVTGFGLRDSIAGIARDQYDDIMKYDLAVTLSDGDGGEAISAIRQTLSGQIDALAAVMETSVELRAGGGVKTVNLIASDDPALPSLIDLHRDGKAVSQPGRGEAVVTQKLGDVLGFVPGKAETLSLGDTGAGTVTVTDFAENYVYHYLFINAETYRDLFGTDPVVNTVFLRLAGDADPYRAGAEVTNLSGVSRVSVAQGVREMVDRMMISLDYVILLVLASAAALAFVVLFNLGNINITERVREIATLKVLGFYGRETGAYVFRENFILSLAGALLGLPLGTLLHRFVMEQIDIDVVSFRVTVTPQSYLLSFLAVLLFAWLTDRILRKKIRAIPMAESLKSVE